MSSNSSSSSVNQSPLASRSTTPSSEISDVSPSRLPQSYAFLDVEFYRLTVLEAIFAKHAYSGCLGVILPNASTPPKLDTRLWSIAQLALDEDHNLSYHIATSTAYELLPASVNIPTDPIQAHQLHAISRSRLRSVFFQTIHVSECVCTLHVLERPSFVFPPLSCTPSFSITGSSRQVGNVPTLDEWLGLWKACDVVTLRMIPESMLHEKPIDLRHKCLFYIGHIPTFLDMLLSKAIGGNPTEPSNFWNIFERGIDPHVDDPDHCHNHSEVPEKDEDWPTLSSIIAFRNGVRARLTCLYDELKSGQRTLTRRIARMLVMTLEHEGFHVETLLYMLIQRAGTGTLPPPGFTTPGWSALVEQWSNIPPPSNPTIVLGPGQITLGHEDSEADDTAPGISEDVDGHLFGWDNESPARTVEVGTFRAEWRPVTNGEFEAFWRKVDNVEIPKSWVEKDGEIEVRTLYGLVPMAIAEGWPVLTSYDDLLRFAQSKGGRLPTEPELRLFLDTYDVGHEGGANIGFRNWHPVPATTGLDSYGGKGSNGGIWEWTSTLFGGHEGLVPTNLFTGYSVDFFDDKHHIVLGASYATIPRLAGRKTVRNFYQHNYPYPWVGGRVVYDIAG